MGFRFLVSVVAVVLVCGTNSVHAFDLVVNGKPVATIVVEGSDKTPAPARAGKRKRIGGANANDAMAAQVLVEWVKKITGAELPVATSAPKDGPAIYIGADAIKAGLSLDDIVSPTHEGIRIVCDGHRILFAGQDGTSTVKAACRLLEEMGCRYLMDAPMGEVYPHAATLAVKDLDIREKPGLAEREIWGSSWSGPTLWKIWNGAGGAKLGASHSWGKYVSKDLFDKHPEYFAMRDGVRKKGDWYCTSNPELRKIFADGVMKALAAGDEHASISPPDGVGYCQCDKCRAQDDPGSIEPSSGQVSVTDRYVDFFNDVARQVGAKYPNAKLGFYCYADYTQAPTRGMTLEPNLVAWIAPLRYCRLHAMGNPICPTRMQLEELVNDWSKVSKAIAYRTYNFDPAECTVPFSLVSVWSHDIPYLQQHGAYGINLETLAAWEIYGPHIYLSLKLAYDPAANSAAIMDDYFQKFFGPEAAPFVKQYWHDIDQEFANLHAHAGCFFAVHRVYTPQFMAHCRQLLDQAAAAAKDNPSYAARVAMNAEGLENAAEYLQIRDALNNGHASDAQTAYQKLETRAAAQVAADYGSHYTADYVKRFLGKQVTAAAQAGTTGRIAAVLPDVWRLGYDEKDQGESLGYAKPEFDDSTWKSVATFSDTLDSQGLPDQKTIMWYRTSVDMPKIEGKASLLVLEADADATVYINGQKAGVSAKKRVPFEVEGGALHPGSNCIAIRVDHSRITELFLGGLLRPIYLVDRMGSETTPTTVKPVETK